MNTYLIMEVKINKDLVIDQTCVKSPVYIKDEIISKLAIQTYIIYKS